MCPASQQSLAGCLLWNQLGLLQIESEIKAPRTGLEPVTYRFLIRHLPQIAHSEFTISMSSRCINGDTSSRLPGRDLRTSSSGTKCRM